MLHLQQLGWAGGPPWCGHYGSESGAVVLLPSHREKIPRLLEEDMTAAEHATVHSLVLMCEQAVTVLGWEDLVLCQTMSCHVSVAAAGALVLSTAGQQEEGWD